MTRMCMLFCVNSTLREVFYTQVVDELSTFTNSIKHEHAQHDDDNEFNDSNHNDKLVSHARCVVHDSRHVDDRFTLGWCCLCGECDLWDLWDTHTVRATPRVPACTVRAVANATGTRGFVPLHTWNKSSRLTMLCCFCLRDLRRWVSQE